MESKLLRIAIIKKLAIDPVKYLENLKLDIMKGTVKAYHGTALDNAKIIKKNGFKGFNAGSVISEAYKINKTNPNSLPKWARDWIESDARMRIDNETGEISLALTKEIAQRWAGSGGEVLKELDHRIRNYLSAKKDGMVESEKDFDIWYDKNQIPYRNLGKKPAILEVMAKLKGSQIKRFKHHVDTYLKLMEEENPSSVLKKFNSHYTDIRIKPNDIKVLKIL